MAQRHELTGEGYAALRRTMIRTMVVWDVAVATAVVFFLHVADAGDSTTGSRAVALTVSVVLLVFVSVRAVRTALKTWKGFELLVSDDSIERRLPGRPTAALARDEVRSLVEVVGKGLTVRGAPERSFLFIPAGIEGYASVRDKLSLWRPIESRPPRRPWIPMVLGVLVTQVLLVAPYLSDDPWIVAPCAILFAVLASWAAFFLKTSPDVPSRLKRSWWFLLLLAILALAAAHSVLFP